MTRFTWMYSALLGAVLGTTGCDQLAVCEGGICIDIDICNPMVETCGEVDTGDEDLCPDGEVVSTEDDCLADGFCYGLPDGRFCTGPDTPVCEEGEIVDNADDCLMDDAFCYQLPDGRFCTGPDTPVCEEGEIVDNAGDCLMDDAFCYQLPDGRFCTGPDAPVCPEGYRPDYEGRCDIADNGLCFTYSEGLDCYLDRFYTVDECTALGGEPVGDPGDGSVVTVGCGDGRAALAYLDVDWIEGGLCCAWLPD